MKFTFKPINAARAGLSNLTAEVSEAARATAIAERDLITAENDEGSTPEIIYERVEAARKKLSILKIAEERANAKLADAQASFETLIKDSANPLIAGLIEKADETAARLTAEIAPLIGERASATGEFKQVIMQATGVHDRLAAAHRIRCSIAGSQRGPGAKPDLQANVLAAETCL